MDMNDTGNRVIIAVVAVLLIIGAWYLGTTQRFGIKAGEMISNDSALQMTTNVQGSASGPMVGGGSIRVGDQPAGSYVMVSSVKLDTMGWVAVRDADGRTLGAARFEAGMHEAVQVPLLRNTESGQKYQALIYEDDGDKKFDLHQDTLVMNADGSVAGTTFSVTHGD